VPEGKDAEDAPGIDRRHRPADLILTDCSLAALTNRRLPSVQPDPGPDDDLTLCHDALLIEPARARTLAVTVRW